jgi:uncharacterized oligopeptide transporter (OPT) family protein
MKPRELTIRGLILGTLITTVFTAANIYLGLKVGLTFASSIPAAVISMAILSVVKDSSILENNIVQTVAYAAGTLSAIIFVLPGLVIVGWWTEFPFWQSFLICLSGGVLGVLFTIPLRRALVTTSDLPYPEGVAAAEVLKVGSGMAGLIGASNSPISGVGILSIVLCASVLVLAVSPTPETRPALVAFALFVTAIVFACATISNDNLQDLKTGQLVGASPMRQQIALIVGVAAGASVIPWVLNLLTKAYGFAGAANIGVVAPNPLPAPQATLISSLALA